MIIIVKNNTFQSFSSQSNVRRPHSGEEIAILEKRKAIYADAKARHPERWRGEIRNWEPVQEVWLNPENTVSADNRFVEEAA